MFCINQLSRGGSSSFYRSGCDSAKLLYTCTFLYAHILEQKDYAFGMPAQALVNKANPAYEPALFKQFSMKTDHTAQCMPYGKVNNIFNS
ncbi:MAG: hypothetical protein CVV42_01615 [Candidatus Riflebacteria bacterium HGW-Riflebacteria-2]|jgi:hypothetical protein|nr:MAG: hypothetical protein CVV42_01615 [Candidatus Riflebacteria bacterium HGW-Riflebacteria-2]